MKHSNTIGTTKRRRRVSPLRSPQRYFDHADVAAAEAVGDKAHNQIFQEGTESGHANYKPVGKGNVPVDEVKADDMLKR